MLSKEDTDDERSDIWILDIVPSTKILIFSLLKICDALESVEILIAASTSDSITKLVITSKFKRVLVVVTSSFTFKVPLLILRLPERLRFVPDTLNLSKISWSEEFSKFSSNCFPLYVISLDRTVCKILPLFWVCKTAISLEIILILFSVGSLIY